LEHLMQLIDRADKTIAQGVWHKTWRSKII
jgi:hypothetical protein